MFISYIYSVVWGGQIGHFMALGRAMALNAPLDPPVEIRRENIFYYLKKWQ